MLEKWTKTSSPCSREMKPKPFSALKNLTVPVATETLFYVNSAPPEALGRSLGRSRRRMRETFLERPAGAEPVALVGLQAADLVGEGLGEPDVAVEAHGDAG